MAHSPKRGRRIYAGKRSPTAHRTLEQARKASTKNQSPQVKKENRMRVAARDQAKREGRVKTGDGKEIHHKTPLAKGGSNAKSNQTVVPRSKNRAHSVRRTNR